MIYCVLYIVYHVLYAVHQILYEPLRLDLGSSVRRFLGFRKSPTPELGPKNHGSRVGLHQASLLVPESAVKGLTTEVAVAS